MNPREKAGEVAPFSERKNQARRMEHHRGQIAVDGNQRPKRNQRRACCPPELLRRRRKRSSGRCGVWEHVDDYVLNRAIDECHGCHPRKKGERDVTPRIFCLRHRNYRSFKSAEWKGQNNGGLEPIPHGKGSRVWSSSRNRGAVNQNENSSGDGEEDQRRQLCNCEKVVCRGSSLHSVHIQRRKKSDQQR